MNLSYFGLSSFKLSSKNFTSIIDPFSKESGLTPPRGNADLLILSEKDNELYSYTQSISGTPFLVDGPGEYDVKEHIITGVPIKAKDGGYITVYLIEVDDVKILDLAHIKKLELTEDEVEDFGNVDVLLVPIGNDSVMDYEDASKAVNLIEPKIVIPMHYKIPGLKVTAQTEEKFIKQMGNKFEKLDKLSLKKKDLQEEGVKVVILEPLR